MKHRDKIKVIKKLIDVPEKTDKSFWGLEHKCLKELMKQFPNDYFWEKISFEKKLNSLRMLRKGHFYEELKKKYKRFCFKLPEYIPPKIESKPIGSIKKSLNKNTLRNLLD